MELTLTEASFALRFPDVEVGPTVADQRVDVLGELSSDAEDGGHAQSCWNAGGAPAVTPFLSGLPPEIGVLGQSRSHDTK